MFLPYTALDAARELAQSALPDAPVIDDRQTPKPGRLRLGSARALRRLALHLEGGQRMHQPYPRRGLPEQQPSL